MSTTLLRCIRFLPCLAAAALSSPAHLQAGQQSDSLTAVRAPRPLGAASLVGALGSGAGVVGGALVGYSTAACGSSPQWFCGLGQATMGAVVGSAVGSALGANLVARRAGRSPTFGKTFLASLGGVLVGTGVGALVAQVDDSGAAALIGFTVGQGFIAALAAAAQGRR
ncbi:MAG: hypothetical protein FIA95_16575 [Gemmatimonadetes bacterium]|nr:hypothetical protein [Gemmatimonadota bacterium]